MSFRLFLLCLFITAPALAATAAGRDHMATFENEIKIHYTVSGEGEPTLVFIHGWACDASVWDKQVEELGRSMRCIAIDLPGHGLSDKPNIDHSMSMYAHAIDAVLHDAGVPSAIIVGHSNGVPVVRQFYREFPDEVRALVLVEGSLRPIFDDASLQKFVNSLSGPNYLEQTAKMVDGMTAPIKDEKLRDKIHKIMLATPQHVAVSEFMATGDPMLWKPDKINVPVLMILAKQPIWTAEYEQFAHNLAPRLDYKMWEHVSHFLMMEKPHEFNETLKTWLQTQGFLDTGNCEVWPPRQDRWNGLSEHVVESMAAIRPQTLATRSEIAFHRSPAIVSILR